LKYEHTALPSHVHTVVYIPRTHLSQSANELRNAIPSNQGPFYCRGLSILFGTSRL